MDDVQEAGLQELQRHAIATMKVAMRLSDGDMNMAIAMLANCFSLQVAAITDVSHSPTEDEDAE